MPHRPNVIEIYINPFSFVVLSGPPFVTIKYNAQPRADLMKLFIFPVGVLCHPHQFPTGNGAGHRCHCSSSEDHTNEGKSLELFIPPVAVLCYTHR